MLDRKRAAAHLLILLALALPTASAEAFEGCKVDVEVAGEAEGCVAIVVLGNAEGDVAFAGVGRADGWVIAVVGSGCATAKEPYLSYGVDNECGKSLPP